MTALLFSVGSHRVGADAAGSDHERRLARPSDAVSLALREIRRVGPEVSRSSAGRPSLSAETAPSAAIRDPRRVVPARPAKVRPVPGAITGLFGEIRGGGRPHGGVDLDGEIGDPVVSAGAGVVVHAGPPPPGMSGYGNLVVVNHPDGTYAMYAHLSAVSTAAGAVVEPGELVGAIGISGSVTGSHLHWEMRIGETPVDPLAWLGT